VQLHSKLVQFQFKNNVVQFKINAVQFKIYTIREIVQFIIVNFSLYCSVIHLSTIQFNFLEQI